MHSLRDKFEVQVFSAGLKMGDLQIHPGAVVFETGEVVPADGLRWTRYTLTSSDGESYSVLPLSERQTDLFRRLFRGQQEQDWTRAADDTMATLWLENVGLEMELDGQRVDLSPVGAVHPMLEFAFAAIGMTLALFSLASTNSPFQAPSPLAIFGSTFAVLVVLAVIARRTRGHAVRLSAAQVHIIRRSMIGERTTSHPVVSFSSASSVRRTVVLNGPIPVRIPLQGRSPTTAEAVAQILTSHLNRMHGQLGTSDEVPRQLSRPALHETRQRE